MSPNPGSISKRLLVLPALAGLLLPVAAGARSLPPSPASTPWEAPAFTADPGAVALAAAQAKGEEDDDVVVLLLEVSYTFDAAGRETYSQHVVYRLINANAHESWSAVEEGWEPWHQERPEIRARVITPDGAEHPLDPATISESGASREAPDMFDDGRVLRAPLPATRPGAVVEEQVTVRDTAPFFDGGVVRLHTLDPGMPVRHARLVLDAPETTPLRWAARDLPGVTPREELSRGRRRLTFEARDLQPADDPEPGLPPEVPRSAYVAFSTGRSWADLAHRYSEIVDRALQGADVGAFLRAASASAAPSQLETIDRILARMSDEVRYTGMELGEGGLIPRTPAETLKRHFGDCKDKAVLLTALLRALDVPAYVALLNAGDGDQDVEEALPGFGLFNHAIVVVPGAPAVWIDPTDPYARAGELPGADQGRLALIASPTATGLVRTPESTSADNRVVETREVFLADLGASRIVETSEYRGALEHDVRAAYSAQDDPSLRQALKEYVAAAYLAEDLAALDHSPPADLSAPMRLRLEARNARRGYTDERNAAVGVSPAALLNRLPDEFTSDDEDDDGPRQDDYVFRRPFTAEIRYRIVPPLGYVPRPLPEACVRHLATATLSEEYAKGDDGAVTATFRLDSGKRRISGKDFAALRAAVHEAAGEKSPPILFDQEGEALLAAGKVPEALAELRRLSALQPKKALPHSRIAKALLAGGMGEAAREEARRAVQLEPKLGASWRHLGWILQHDDVGRRFGPGFDRAAAIAAYRKGKEADPKDAELRADLAILLEHDASGLRYGPASDLAAAIDEYKALRKDLDVTGMNDNLIIALVRAGRFAEARELAAKSQDSQTARVMSLVATAALDGAAAAVREGERAAGDDKARAATLQSAAQTLMLVRRYPEAAALMERASRQSDNAAGLLSLAELLRRARPHEEIRLAEDEPGAPARKLMLLTIAPDLDVKQVAALFSHDVGAEILAMDGAKAERMFETGLSSARKKLRDQDMPYEVAMDVAFGTLQETAAGDDATGYRVSFSFPMDHSSGLVVYVVREAGSYRIAAVGKSLPMLAYEALRRIGKGDLAGARKWLDWATEEEAGEPGSTDPVPATPFLALWHKGSPGDAEEIRCAATSLLGEEDEGKKALPALRACREAATDPARRNAVDAALAIATRTAHLEAEMDEVTRRLLAAAPGSDNAERLRARSLADRRRWEELRGLAEQRLQRLPEDAWAGETLVQADLGTGDLGQAETRLRQSVKAAKATAEDLNQLAWLLLERGQVDDEALGFGQRAAALSDYKNAPSLHTLASLYAERGRTAEAYHILLQSLDARAVSTPGPDDWYVLGRLAEQYGLPDLARKYYQRVPSPASREDEPISTHALAARRLASLGGEAKAERRASR